MNRSARHWTILNGAPTNHRDVHLCVFLPAKCPRASLYLSMEIADTWPVSNASPSSLDGCRNAQASSTDNNDRSTASAHAHGSHSPCEEPEPHAGRFAAAPAAATPPLAAFTPPVPNPAAKDGAAMCDAATPEAARATVGTHNPPTFTPSTVAPLEVLPLLLPLPDPDPATPERTRLTPAVPALELPDTATPARPDAVAAPEAPAEVATDELSPPAVALPGPFLACPDAAAPVLAVVPTADLSDQLRPTVPDVPGALTLPAPPPPKPLLPAPPLPRGTILGMPLAGGIPSPPDSIPGVPPPATADAAGPGSFPEVTSPHPDVAP